MADIIRVIYTINNKVEGTTPFTYTEVLHVEDGSVFLDVMNLAAQQNPYFKFQDTLSKYGAYITCINNLCEDKVKKIYWAFTKHDDKGKACLLPVGVSTYKPSNNDHIVFEYLPKSDWDNIPQGDCSRTGCTASKDDEVISNFWWKHYSETTTTTTTTTIIGPNF